MRVMNGARYFVTGSGTDIGKTYFICEMARYARMSRKILHLQKPIMSGHTIEDAESDVGRMAAASDVSTKEEIAQLTFSAALAPDLAAKAEGRTIDWQNLLKFSRTKAGPLCIEGVGGVMSPLTDQYLVLDWIEALTLPVIFIGGTYLGAITHTLSGVAALRQRNIPIRLIVLNESAQHSIGLDKTSESILPHVQKIGAPVVKIDREGRWNREEIWKKLFL